MSTTEQVQEAATKLGKLIAEHPATKKFEEVVKKIEADTEAQRLMNDLNRHGQAIAEKEAKGQPIEVDDKHKLRDLQQAVAMNSLLSEMQMVQMDYVDLMRDVDARMGGAGQGG